MREYALIMLTMPEYTFIHLNKQSSEYARILNVFHGVQRLRSLYKLLSSYRDRRITSTIKHLNRSVLQEE